MVSCRESLKTSSIVQNYKNVSMKFKAPVDAGALNFINDVNKRENQLLTSATVAIIKY